MDDGTNSNSFVPVGRPAGVVINLAARAKAYRELRASVALLESTRRQDDFKAMEAKRGRELITKGIGIIQTNASPEEAIQFLKDTLAAISGSSA